MSRVHRGFTLIELLVVVAIIALLISILLPSLAQARATARVVKCLANEKTMSQAAVMYADAQSGYHPPLWVHSSHKPVDLRWTANYTYRQMFGISTNIALKPEGIFCPDAPEREIIGAQWGRIYGHNNIGTVPARLGQPGGKATLISAYIAKFTHPADKVQFVDATDWAAPGVWDAVNPAARWTKHGDTAPAYGDGNYHAAFRHMGANGINTSYFDGHAEYLTLTDAWTIGGGPSTVGRAAEIRKWELPR